MAAWRYSQAKEKEVEKVMRVLQQQRSSEYEGVAQRLAAEEAARKLDEEAAQVRLQPRLLTTCRMCAQPHM